MEVLDKDLREVQAYHRGAALCRIGKESLPGGWEIDRGGRLRRRKYLETHS